MARWRGLESGIQSRPVLIPGAARRSRPDGTQKPARTETERISSGYCYSASSAPKRPADFAGIAVSVSVQKTCRNQMAEAAGPVNPKGGPLHVKSVCDDTLTPY